jgi:hypothetical protein
MWSMREATNSTAIRSSGYWDDSDDCVNVVNPFSGTGVSNAAFGRPPAIPRTDSPEWI